MKLYTVAVQEDVHDGKLSREIIQKKNIFVRNKVFVWF